MDNDEAAQENLEKRWYAVHTYSGYEAAVARNLKHRIESLGMEEKIFNVINDGFTRKDDSSPERFMNEPVKSGPLKGEFLQRAEWDRMLDEYYDLHGWDRCTSWPTQEKLMELDLQEWVGRLGQTG